MRRLIVVFTLALAGGMAGLGCGDSKILPGVDGGAGAGGAKGGAGGGAAGGGGKTSSGGGASGAAGGVSGTAGSAAGAAGA